MPSYKTSSWLPNLILLLAFVPNLNLAPFLQADLQPFAGVLAFLFIVSITIMNGKIPRSIPSCYLFATISIILIYFIPSIVKYSISDVSLAAVSYLVGPALFVFFYYNLTKLSLTLVRFIFWILVVFGLLQVFLPIGMLREIDFVLSPLFTRFSMMPRETMRGISLVYPEPSNAAPYIVLAFMLYYFFYRLEKVSFTEIFAVIIFSILQIFWNKSGTVGVLAFLFLIIFSSIKLFNLFKHKKVFQIFCLVIICLLVVIALSRMISVYQDKVRFVKLLSTLIEIFSSNEKIVSIENVYIFGSTRLISVYVGYMSVFLSILGLGLSASKYHFLNLCDFLQINPMDFIRFQEKGLINLKAHSYVSELTIDTGLIMLTVHILLAVYIIKRSLEIRHIDYLLAAIPLLGMIQIYFDSLITLPAPWIMLSFCGIYELRALQGVFENKINPNHLSSKKSLKK